MSTSDESERKRDLRDIGATTDRRFSLRMKNSPENLRKQTETKKLVLPQTRPLKSTARSETQVQSKGGMHSLLKIPRGKPLKLSPIDPKERLRKTESSQVEANKKFETESRNVSSATLPPIKPTALKKEHQPRPSHDNVFPGPGVNPTAVYWTTESPGPSEARAQRNEDTERSLNPTGRSSVTKLPRFIERSQKVSFLEPAPRKDVDVDEKDHSSLHDLSHRRSTFSKSTAELQEYFSGLSHLDKEQRVQAMADAVMEVAEGKEIGVTRMKKTKEERTREKKDLERKKLVQEKAAKRIVNFQLEQRMAAIHWPAIKQWKIDEWKRKQLVRVRAEADLVRTYYNRMFELQDHLILTLKNETQDKFFNRHMHIQTSVACDNLISWMRESMKQISQNYTRTAYHMQRNMIKRREHYFEDYALKLPQLTTKYIDADLAEFQIKMAAELYTSRETEKHELQQELFEKTCFLNESKKELTVKLEREIIPYVRLVQKRKSFMEPDVRTDEKNVQELQMRTLQLERLKNLHGRLQTKVNFRKANYEVFHEKVNARRKHYNSNVDSLHQDLQDKTKLDAEILQHLVVCSSDSLAWLKERVKKAEKLFSMIIIIRKYETFEESLFSYHMTRQTYKTGEEQDKFNYGEPQTLTNSDYCHQTCNRECSEGDTMRNFYKRAARVSYTTQLLKNERDDLAKESKSLRECARSIITGENEDYINWPDIQIAPIVLKPSQRITNSERHRTRPGKPYIPGPSSKKL